MQDESLRSCLCCHEYNSNSRSGGQQGPQETAFPPLNTFYSSSEFSHSAADEILLFASENQNYNHYLLFFFFLPRGHLKRPESGGRSQCHVPHRADEGGPVAPRQ